MSMTRNCSLTAVATPVLTYVRIRFCNVNDNLQQRAECCPKCQRESRLADECHQLSRTAGLAPSPLLELSDVYQRNQVPLATEESRRLIKSRFLRKLSQGYVSLGIVFSWTSVKLSALERRFTVRAERFRLARDSQSITRRNVPYRAHVSRLSTATMRSAISGQ